MSAMAPNNHWASSVPQRRPRPRLLFPDIKPRWREPGVRVLPPGGRLRRFICRVAGHRVIRSKQLWAYDEFWIYCGCCGEIRANVVDIYPTRAALIRMSKAMDGET